MFSRLVYTQSILSFGHVVAIGALVGVAQVVGLNVTYQHLNIKNHVDH